MKAYMSLRTHNLCQQNCFVLNNINKRDTFCARELLLKEVSIFGQEGVKSKEQLQIQAV